MPTTRFATARLVTEWILRAVEGVDAPDEVDVRFRGPGGSELQVPCFSSRPGEWRVRFAAPIPGTWSYEVDERARLSMLAADADGLVEVSAAPVDGHDLQARGGIRLAADRSRLEDADGQPFFWLGDTWWMGLSRRLRWPDDFQRLAADRAAKGFSVIQIVAGLPPDQAAFDQRSDNEAGYCWAKDFSALNPGFWDQADLRIQHLVRVGLVPCILGMWGYYLPWMGVARARRHWREIVARWGAYPVIWCLAGETLMPWYLAAGQDRERFVAEQRQGWTELAAYVRGIDPYHRLLTTHPVGYGSARDQIVDAALLDIDMLQGGQGGHSNYSRSAKQVVDAVSREPRMPVIQGEVCYEANMGTARDEAQRFLFWSAMLSGVKGYTYGADGIWAVNTREQPFGPSPWGMAWGDTPWDEAMSFAGARTVGVGRAILERFPWWRLEQHQEWITPAAAGDDWHGSFIAGIPGRLRIAYVPHPWNAVTILGLEADRRWNASWIDATSGRAHPLGAIAADAEGHWKAPPPPVMRDWVLVLENDPSN